MRGQTWARWLDYAANRAQKGAATDAWAGQKGMPDDSGSVRADPSAFGILK